MVKSLKKKPKFFRINKKSPYFIAFVAFLILVCLILITLAVINLAYANTVYPFVKIGKTGFTGLSPFNTENKIIDKVKEFENNGINFSFEYKTWNAKPSDIGLRFDVRKTSRKVFEIGRGNSESINYIQQLEAFFGQQELKMEYTLDNKKFESYINENLVSIETPSQNATLEFRDGELVLIESKEGKSLAKSLLKASLIENLSNLSPEPIKIELTNSYPVVEDKEVESAKMTAITLAESLITLSHEYDYWEVYPEEIIQWIEFVPSSDIENYYFTGLDNIEKIVLAQFELQEEEEEKSEIVLKTQLNSEKVGNYLRENIAPEINQNPENARFKVENGIVSLYKESENGVEIDVEKSTQRINDEVINHNKALNHAVQGIKITLEIKETQAEITKDYIYKLGKMELIGKGESDFSYSPSNRIHNIGVGAEANNGTLLKPGEEYSLAATLERVDASTGYLPELVIKRDKTVPEYGGGLCQIATTVFRGAVNTGLQITQRRNHAYSVHYYSPQGTDATIYLPEPDVRFMNDTPGHVLVQTKIEGYNLIFEFYGISDGRTVEMQGPYTWDYGYKGSGSMRTSWTQVVYGKDGNKIREETFYSDYDSPSKYPH